MKKNPDEIDLGMYIVGDAQVEVIADKNECGGSFSYNRNGPFIEMRIGLQDDRFVKVFTVAMHELVELSLRLSKGSFEPAFNGLARTDTGRYRFFFDHDQYTEAIDHAADALYFMEPKLFKAWKKRNED